MIDKVTDIHEKVSATDEFYNIGAVKNIHAAARSVFILERYIFTHKGTTITMGSGTASSTMDRHFVSESTLFSSTRQFTCTLSQPQ